MVVRLAGIPWQTAKPRRARIKGVRETGNRQESAIAVQWRIDKMGASVTAAVPAGGSRALATAVRAREMPATALLAQERATGVRTAVGETAWAIAVCPAVVDLVTPAPLAAEGPAEAAHEPAVHVALLASAADEVVVGVDGVALAADGGELSHKSGGTHELTVI